MKENLFKLNQEFIKIKKLGLIKSLRKGPTGVGFTFEALLNKKEDSKSKPDYLGIELKTKLGYSKTPITLFTCVPLRDGQSAIEYIITQYGYFSKGQYNYTRFSRCAYCNFINKNYITNLKLIIDFQKSHLKIGIYKYEKFVEILGYWEFKTLEKKLKTKLNYLAIVEAYPYTRNQETYYKYFTLKTYKLKSFLEFLELIKQDKIHVEFYLKRYLDGRIENHGVAFKLDNEYINKLFELQNL